MEKAVHYTPYDDLRDLNNASALLVYSLFFSFKVFLSAAAGPVAVAVGLHMVNHTDSASEALGKERQRHYMMVALWVAMVRSAVLASSATILQISRVCPKLVRIWVAEYLVKPRHKSEYYETTCCSGMSFIECFPGGPCISPWGLLWALVTFLSLAGAYIALHGALAALASKLLIDKVASWPTYAGLAVGSGLVVGFFVPKNVFHCNGINIPLPNTPPIYAIAGIIVTRIAHIQGVHLCSYGTAAAAGAAFGTILIFIDLPKFLLNDFYTGNEFNLMRRLQRKEPFEDKIWASRLFQTKNYNLGIEEGRKLDAMKRCLEDDALAEEQFRRNQDKNKVYWSRPEGLDKITHYVLIINGHKYELRDVSENHDGRRIRYRTSSISMTMITRNSCFLYDPGKPDERRQYGVYLIGWTTLSHEEINSVCKEIDENWRYHWARLVASSRAGNCQHFLREVADRIIEQGCYTRDWAWFVHDQIGPEQSAQVSAMERSREDYWRSIFGNGSGF